jgi:hypothetical protein
MDDIQRLAAVRHGYIPVYLFSTLIRDLQFN